MSRTSSSPLAYTTPRRVPFARRDLYELLVWFAVCALVCFGLLSLENGFASSFKPRPWTESLYVSRLSLAAALGLSVLFFVLRVLDRWLPDALRWAPAMLIACAVVPLAHEAAHELSLGDRVQATGYATAVKWAVFAALDMCAVLLWAWHRFLFAAPVWAGLGVFAAAVCFYIQLEYLRTYAFLAPFALGGSVVAASTLVWRLVLHFERQALPVLGAATVVVLGFAGAGVFVPRLLDSGRRHVRIDETSAMELDTLLFGRSPAWRRVRFFANGAGGQRFTCADLPKPPPWPAPRLIKSKRRNVVIITVDAMRRDAWDWREKDRQLAPALGWFRGHTIEPSTALTTYPATLFALAGAFTGLSPSQLLFAPQPPPGIFRLAKKRVDSVRVLLADSYWFKQKAFGRYVTQGAATSQHASAAALTSATIRHLRNMRKKNRSHMVWVHYMEPHSPYRSHSRFNFGSEPAQRYKSEIAFFDDQVRRLLRFLKREKWFKDSLILFFSDHGQALGERRYWGHHVFLNRWIAEVPFLFRYPNAKQLASPAPGVVQLPDVAPTVLQYLGVPRTRALAGQSLLRGLPPPSRPVVAEAFPIRGQTLFELADEPLSSVDDLAARIRQIQTGTQAYHPKVSLTQGDYRLIVRRSTGSTELYNTRKDPAERRDLSVEQPEQLERMLGYLEQWHLDRSREFFCDIKSLKTPPNRPPTKAVFRPPPRKKPARDSGASGKPRAVPTRGPGAPGKTRGAKPAAAPKKKPLPRRMAKPAQPRSRPSPAPGGAPPSDPLRPPKPADSPAPTPDK